MRVVLSAKQGWIGKECGRQPKNISKATNSWHNVFLGWLWAIPYLLLFYSNPFSHLTPHYIYTPPSSIFSSPLPTLFSCYNQRASLDPRLFGQLRAYSLVSLISSSSNMADSASSKRMWCSVPEKFQLHAAMLALQFGYAGFHVVSRAALNMGVSKLVFPVYRNIIALLLLLPFAYFLEKLVLLFLTN